MPLRVAKAPHPGKMPYRILATCRVQCSLRSVAQLPLPCINITSAGPVGKTTENMPRYDKLPTYLFRT